jgi:uncharacterized membrane protein
LPPPAQHPLARHLTAQERSKIGHETLTNVSGMSRDGSSFSRTSLSAVDELLVVTIMVAAESGVQIPQIRSANDLKEALSALGGVTTNQVSACLRVD